MDPKAMELLSEKGLVCKLTKHKKLSINTVIEIDNCSPFVDI